MTIKPGDRLPQATFKTDLGEGPTNITIDAVFQGKKVALFGVPGAFTPTCSKNHLAGFVEKEAELRRKGIDTIAVVAVNDVFVMTAWAKANQADGKILFLADGSGEFTRAAGLEADMSGAGFGQRSRRYSMLVEDGTVKSLEIEEAPGQAEKSSAKKLLESL